MGLIQVRVIEQQQVNWHNSITCKYVLQDEQVDVWRIRISQNITFNHQWLKVMLPDEIARGNKYLQKKDQQRFVVSRGTLRYLLGRYTGENPGNIRFVIGENKKPGIYMYNLQYNVSHAGDWVMIAVSKGVVGIDTEEIDPDFSFREILADNFSLPEISYIHQQKTAAVFYKLWTRKEALTKATAIGLDDNLQFIPSLTGDHEIESTILGTNKNWTTYSFNPDFHNIACLATELANANVNYWDINAEDLLSSFK